MSLDLNLVRTFWILAATGSHTQAAAHLHLSRSTITKHIHRLEHDLGVALLDHTQPGTVRLTPAGRRFRAAAGPLLTDADRARAAAQGADSHHQLRVGFPADGTGAVRFLKRLNLSAVAQLVRDSYPGTTIACRELPFGDLDSCLPTGQVDLLWTMAPVLHPGVESLAMDVIAHRIVISGPHHPRLEGHKLTVEEVLPEPVIVCPTAPSEWMKQFWLGDLRSRGDAHLIDVDVRDSAGALRHLHHSKALIVTVETLIPGLAPGLRASTLADVAPVRFYAARRRGDRRGALHCLIDALHVHVPPRLI